MKRAILLWQDNDEWYAADVPKQRAAKIRLADSRADKITQQQIGTDAENCTVMGITVGVGKSAAEALRNFVGPTSELMKMSERIKIPTGELGAQVSKRNDRAS